MEIRKITFEPDVNYDTIADLLASERVYCDKAGNCYYDDSIRDYYDHHSNELDEIETADENDDTTATAYILN